MISLKDRILANPLRKTFNSASCKSMKCDDVTSLPNITLKLLSYACRAVVEQQ